MNSDITTLIPSIRAEMQSAFAKVDAWFDASPQLFGLRHPSGGWTIGQVLEHISLTNHFLMILIKKGRDKALALAEKRPDWRQELEGYAFSRDRLTEVGLHGSFPWFRPDHMEPKGEQTLEEVRLLLRRQCAEVEGWLQDLSAGQGVLYKTTMTVNSLGKIDVYEYIYFLVQHAQRHLAQMEKIKAAHA